MDSVVSKFGKVAFLEENRGIILWDTQGENPYDLEYFCHVLDEFRLKIKAKCNDMELEFAICRDEA
ncbi:hypothetical protein, partial [Acinetobacter baumannii]|uniref:hypothetical protein n=1 Tax=Acinetobacter baumannii TaxID=470 RepID=UPI001BB3665F